MYCDLPGNYSWGAKNDGNVQVTTGGAEKEIFNVQFSCLKSGRKLIPIIILKCAPLTEISRRNSVAVELMDWFPENSGNNHPPEDKVYLTSTKSASSSGEYEITHTKQVS